VLQEATALAKLMEDLAHSEWARTTSGDRRDKLELRWDPRSQVHGKSPDLTLLWIAFDHTWE
jgi:hypothetical protein